MATKKPNTICKNRFVTRVLMANVSIITFAVIALIQKIGVLLRAVGNVIWRSNHS